MLAKTLTTALPTEAPLLEQETLMHLLNLNTVDGLVLSSYSKRNLVLGNID